MGNVYVKLNFGHRSFTTGKTAIVAVPDYCEYLTTYERLAKEKVCKHLGLDDKEVHVFDYTVLGENVLFLINDVVDFVNEDSYDEMDNLSKSLFGEDWDKDCCEDGVCCITKHECIYTGSCKDCPTNK